MGNLLCPRRVEKHTCLNIQRPETPEEHKAALDWMQGFVDKELKTQAQWDDRYEWKFKAPNNEGERKRLLVWLKWMLELDWTNPDAVEKARLYKYLPTRGIRKRGRRFKVVDWGFNRNGRTWGGGRFECYPNKTSIARGVQRLFASLPDENKIGVSKYDIEWFQLDGDYWTGVGLREIDVHFSY